MSVFNQTISSEKYEFIIIDGNSSDLTRQIIQKYSNKIDILF